MLQLQYMYGYTIIRVLKLCKILRMSWGDLDSPRVNYIYVYLMIGYKV